MDVETETHIVKFAQLGNKHFIRAHKGQALRVTVELVNENEHDPLLRDVGRPGWPHKAT